MSSRVTISLIIGGLPLLAYPAVALAGIMSLAGERMGHEAALLETVRTSFLIGTLVYPLVYILCAIAAVWVNKKDAAFAFKVSVVPLVFISILAVLCLGWFQLES